MKKKKALLLLNLNAGTGKLKSKLADILNLMTRSEFETVVHITQCSLDAQKVAQEYAESGIDRIICAGGDGTMDEVARGVTASGRKTPIGYIPCGTTNDFGYTLGLSASPMEAAVVAVGGQPLLCDLACFNGTFYTYTAAFGLFTEVSYATPQNMKNIFVRLAYLLNGAMQLPKTKSYHMTVKYSDGENKHKLTGDFIYGMIANSNSVGGFRGIIASDVILDDGLFEMILVRTPKNVMDLTTTINDLMKHKFNREHIFCCKVTSACFTAEEEVPWTLDGEFGGKTECANIEILHKAVAYVCNKGKNQV